jgi:hypothetical protein
MMNYELFLTARRERTTTAVKAFMLIMRTLRAIEELVGSGLRED